MMIMLAYIFHDWPSVKAEVLKELQLYWSCEDEIAVLDGIMLKGIGIAVPASLQNKTLNQLHLNHMT